MQEYGWRNFGKLIGRTALFLAFLLLVLKSFEYLFDERLAKLDEAVANSASGEGDKNKPEDKDDMMDRNEGGKETTFNLKKYAELRSRLGRNQELLFTAHLENYFEGTEIPNPLYFTSTPWPVP
jgi:hypothetical protein